MGPTIAVLIPCFNEEKTVAEVVKDFSKELPYANVYVYDNCSTDQTAQNAMGAGAIVVNEYGKGKGHVVRAMFRDITADIYIMADGDSTYPAHKVHDLIRPIKDGSADMAVGTRLDNHEEGSFRSFHRFGNNLIKSLINILFGTNLNDILSGYRCFNGKFVKSIPILSKGFEVETELTLHALDKSFKIIEIPVSYFKRPQGSVSKLNTYRDGLLILKTIFTIFRDYRPFKCSLFLSIFFFVTGILLGAIPISDFVISRQVTHPSTAVLATGLVLVSLLTLITGFMLDTINRRNRELYQLLTDSLIHELHKSNTEESSIKSQMSSCRSTSHQ